MSQNILKRKTTDVRYRYRLNELNRPEIIMRQIGENVSFLRKRLKLNREDLVSEFERLRVDMNVYRLKNIEQGKTQSIADIINLANYFDVEFNKIVNENLKRDYR